MKYLKRFEDINSEPELGDYVICSEFPDNDYDIYYEIDKFLIDNVGRYVKNIEDDDDLSQDYCYIIEYEYVPEHLFKYFPFEKGVKNRCRRENRKCIIDFSKDKEELEAKISANKYNL